MSFRKGRARRFLATLLSLILVFVNESALSNVSWAAPNDYDNFGPTEENPIVIEVEACYYDRGEGDFPVAIGSATEGNWIDGGDRIKARVSGDSVTLSWSPENAPTQICIEGDPDWDIRDISDGQTSVEIEFESGRDFYYIKADYGNGGGFGPSEEKPYFIEILTEGIGHVEVPEGYPEEDYFENGNLLQIRSDNQQIVVDVCTNDDPEVEHNITGLYRHFEDPENPDNEETNYDDAYNYGDITGGVCQWAAYNAETKKLTFALSEEDKEFWGVFVTFEGGGFGPSEEKPYFIEILTEGIGHVEVPEGYPEEDYFENGNLLQIRSDNQQIVVDVCTNDDPEVEHNITGLYRHFEDPENPDNEETNYDDAYNYGDITGGVCQWAAYNAETKKLTFTLSEEDKEFWGVFVTFEGGGDGGDYHNIGVDFLNDVSALPGDDTSKLRLMIVGRQSDNGIVYLDSNTDQWEFGKGSDGQHVFDLSVPDNAVCLGFQLSTAGKVVKSASYTIGEDTHELTETEIADLTSDGYFNIPVNDGESWVELIVFSVVVEEENQPGGGDDKDVTYSEDDTISGNITKDNVTVSGGTLTIADNSELRVDKVLTVEAGANVVGASDSSTLTIATFGKSYGLALYRSNGQKVTSGTDEYFENNGGPETFTWNPTNSRWEKESGGTDAPWYTVSYGNSANLTTEHGKVYVERVHVGEITYTTIASEYNASETDQIYSMEETIFHQKTEEEANDPEYQDTLMRYGIGGSDGDIFFKNDVTGASIDFKFIPDFGYQLKNIYTVENVGMLDEFEAADTISTFKFNVMQGQNVHFDVKFVEANNTVTGNAGISSGASISSANASSSGALEMTVNTGVPNNNIPQGSEALAAYDISLKNVVSKGEGRGNWETELTDLGSNSATVTLPVADTANYTYSVIREHEGEDAVTLDATIVDGGISFETNKFSTYTIVKKPKEKPLTSVKLEDEAGKIVTGTITLPVGSNRIYTIVRGQESPNKIGIQYSDDAANFEALLEEDQDSLKVVIGEVAGASVKGGFKIVNEDVLVDGNPTVLASFNVKGTNPAWVGKKVSASVVSATDVAVNISIKPFTALGNELYNDRYYYRVECTGENKEIKSGLEYDPYVFFVKPNEDGNTVATVYPFVDEEGDEIRTPGLGDAWKFNVKVSVVMKKTKTASGTPDSADVFLESQTLSLAAATKAPHYAEKISVKSGKTSFFSGEKSVKAGTVTFGKNDTFITNEDWIIRSVTDPKGNVFGSTTEPYETSEDTLDECIGSCGLVVYKGNSEDDNGIYVDSVENAVPGKYTVIVATEGQNGQTPEAKITFTVKGSIYEMRITAPDRIYKPDNKKATVKATVKAYSAALSGYGGAVTYSEVKSPKVKYEVGIWNNETDTLDKVDGISVDSKGTITVDKNYKVTDDNRDNMYSVISYANEYEGQYENIGDSTGFTIVNEATKIKTLEIYIQNGDTYTLVKPNALIPYDCRLAYAVKDVNGDYIVGGDNKDGHDEPELLVTNDIYGSKGIAIESTVNQKINAPTKVTFTARSIDGSSVKQTFTYTYSNDSDNYDALVVAQYTMQPKDCKYISQTGDDAYQYTLPAEYGSNPVLMLAIADRTILEDEPGKASETSTYAIMQSINEEKNSLISGSLSVSGAKVIADEAKEIEFDYAISGRKVTVPKNQYLLVVVNKPEVVVTLSKPTLDPATGKVKTVKQKYVIKTSAQLPKTAAPKIKSTQMAVPTGTHGEYTYEKLPLGREYSGKEVFEFKLSNKLALPAGVEADDVYVKMRVIINGAAMGMPMDYPYSFDSSDNSGLKYVEDGKDAYIKLKCSSIFGSVLKCAKLPISIEYYYLDDSDNPVYLTKAPTTSTLTFTKYAKTFKINATQTLKFTLSDGVNPAKVESATIAGKGTNVKEVVIKRLYNCNVKGIYNDFTEIFENEEGWLGVKGGALTTLNNEAVAAKNKLPSARTGYVLCEVTYNDGTKEEVMSKVTVKFAK